MRKIKSKKENRIRFLGELKTTKQIIEHGKREGYGSDFDQIFYKELERQLITFFGKWGYHLDIPVEKAGDMKIIAFGASKHDFWGAYDPEDGTWAFQATLAYLPEHIIEYLVLHELCHYCVPNHGEEFQKLMKTHMPDYLERLNELEGIEERNRDNKWLV